MPRSLDKRLQMVADMVPAGGSAADVGCDHGLLMAYLLQQNKVERGLCCDVSLPSLQKAQRLAERADLPITCIHTDGLDGVPPVDTVIIAGMGGHTICGIIDRCDWLHQPQCTLVLQPMTHAGVLRIFLGKQGFAVVKERVVCERGKVYTVMLVCYTGEKERISPLQSLVGMVPFCADEQKAAYYDGVLKMLYDRKAGLLAQQKDTGHIDRLIVDVQKLY